MVSPGVSEGSYTWDSVQSIGFARTVGEPSTTETLSTRDYLSAAATVEQLLSG